MIAIQLPQLEVFGIYNSRKVGPDGKVSKKRKTSMFEIELPVESGGISHINGESRPITTDLLVCAKPGQIRYTKFPYQCYYVHMLIPDPALCELVSELPDYLTVADRKPYEELFVRLCQFTAPLSRDDELLLQSILLELIHTLRREAQAQVLSKSKKNAHFFDINAVLSYIKHNLCEVLSLERLAARFSLSPIYFHTLFKKATGVTLREYVEEQRLKKAADLLLTTDMTLTQIAYAVGFSSQSYFSFVFRKKTKKTPRDYAKSICRKYEE